MCAFESHLSDLWLGRSTGRSPPCHGGGCWIIPHPSRYTSVPKRLGTTLIKLQTRVQIPSLVLYRYSSIGIRAHHYEWWGWRFESFYRCSWPYSITASVYWIVSPKIWVRLPVGSLLIIAKIHNKTEICPICGNLMSKGAEKCQACYDKERAEHIQYKDT